MDDFRPLRRVWIIDSHPRVDSLGAALARCVADGAEEAGHEVWLTALRDLEFDPNARQQTLEPDLMQCLELWKWTGHVVIVHPTWWGSYPALLKGWLDRLMLPGFAFAVQPDGAWRGLLKGRTGQIITTMDTPFWIYRWLLKAPGVRALKDATLGFCGVGPVRVKLLGPVHSSTIAQRQSWMDSMRRTGRDIEKDFRTGGRAMVLSWLKAARLQFYPFPLMVLSAGVWSAAAIGGNSVRILPWLLAAGCTALVEFITVLTNDLHDQSSDRQNNHAGPFTGGSRVLVEGNLTETQLRHGRAFGGVLLLLLAGLFAFVMPAAASGLIILVGLGLVLGIGYSATPVRLSGRSLGELDVAFTHSVLVALLGFVSQGGSLWHPVPWTFAAVIGVSVLPSIILAGFPDLEADGGSGKITLAVRWGRRRAAEWAMGLTVLAVLLLALTAGRGTGSLLCLAGASLHGLGLFAKLKNYHRTPRGGRLDGLLVLALSFMVWFVLEALCRFQPNVGGWML